jgi:hypothetical protein
MNDPVLAAVPADLAAAFARRLFSGQLPRRAIEDRLDAGAAGELDHFVDRRARLLDQLHHGKNQLSVAGKKISQNVTVVRGDGLVL